MRLKTPLDIEIRKKLKAGNEVLLSGVLYTARDQTHKRLIALLRAGRKLPFDPKGAVIYYTGPTPSREKGRAGSCGPTTSARMDEFAPILYDKGVAATIGKGMRSEKVRRSIKKNKALYFLAIGGCGAYLSKRVKRAEPIAFKDLGPEAIFRFEVKDFPLVVGIDSKGNDVYEKFKRKDL